MGDTNLELFFLWFLSPTLTQFALSQQLEQVAVTVLTYPVVRCGSLDHLIREPKFTFFFVFSSSFGTYPKSKFEVKEPGGVAFHCQ
ncbi:hypothetical protein EDD17DRAFT_1047778 [Pisolithus thermaeus]|nr:hypothetical protein F5141DRAFT_551398 [Pisolithus sp. B1]KAI6156394.1 hypothetical protein EDD17DRAFT_1047778 [Pisolithus thermaeus]